MDEKKVKWFTTTDKAIFAVILFSMCLTMYGGYDHDGLPYYLATRLISVLLCTFVMCLFPMLLRFVVSKAPYDRSTSIAGAIMSSLVIWFILAGIYEYTHGLYFSGGVNSLLISCFLSYMIFKKPVRNARQQNEVPTTRNFRAVQTENGITESKATPIKTKRTKRLVPTSTKVCLVIIAVIVTGAIIGGIVSFNYISDYYYDVGHAVGYSDGLEDD